MVWRGSKRGEVRAEWGRDPREDRSSRFLLPSLHTTFPTRPAVRRIERSGVTVSAYTEENKSQECLINSLSEKGKLVLQ